VEHITSQTKLTRQVEALQAGELAEQRLKAVIGCECVGKLQAGELGGKADVKRLVGVVGCGAGKGRALAPTLRGVGKQAAADKLH